LGYSTNNKDVEKQSSFGLFLKVKLIDESICNISERELSSMVPMVMT
jgi:hypothetical protein